MDLVYRLRSRRERFSPVEQKIVAAILDDVAYAASATIDALAARAGVSKSALSRFAKHVGCQDIRALRMELAQAAAVGSRYLREAGPAPEASRFFGNIVADIEAALHRHLHAFDEARVSAAAKLMLDARLVQAFGMGGCSSLFAAELQQRLVRFGLPVSACQDPVTMRVASAALSAEDTVVMLSMTGVTPAMIDVAALLKQYDCRIVALTPADSPLAAHADAILPILIDETDFIYKPTAARYGMMLAVDLLATEIALRRRPASREALRRAKLALDAYRGGGDRLPLGD